MDKQDTIKILGVEIDRVSEKEALSIFEGFLHENHCSQIITLNPEMLLEAQKNDDFKQLIMSSELVFPDGVGLVYAAKMTGQPISERITGIDFTRKALQILANNNKTAYFLGAKPGIAKKAAENISKEIENLKIVGAHDGYFKETEELALIDEINSSGADMLCLALGSPKQEYFAKKYKDKLNCKLVIGIGGSFDVWSGTLKRAPQFYIDHNIEWLYRLIQEPSRIKRMIKLPLFLVKVAFHKEKI